MREQGGRSEPGSRVKRAASIRTHDPLTPARCPSDRELVAAMRRGESAAFVDFIERFERLLRAYATRLAFRKALRWEIIGEVLDDVALRLVAPGSAIPDNLAAYVVAAFRNRLLNQLRARVRHARAVREAAEDVLLDCTFAEAKEAIAACSAALLHASRGSDYEDSDLSATLTRLSVQLGANLTTEERVLLVAASENVPQREVAAWLGVSHEAARKRLQRLRSRLGHAARDHVERLAPDERRELERFFRRCRTRVPAGVSSAGAERTGDGNHE